MAAGPPVEVVTVHMGLSRAAGRPERALSYPDEHRPPSTCAAPGARIDGARAVTSTGPAGSAPGTGSVRA